MQVCVECGASFDAYPRLNGVRLNLGGRKRCLECLPLRHLNGPRKSFAPGQKQKVCDNCGATFPTRVRIDGVEHNLKNRRFCLACSPLGAHNTSQMPPGALAPEALAEYRRKKRNAKTYRYQKRRRKTLKAELVAAAGAKCVDCGFDGAAAAFDFHHRDAAAKEFSISKFSGSYARLLVEVAKCDLLCANCHRLRHAALDALIDPHPVVAFRRRTKDRAVAHMGGECAGCARAGATAIFDFHHVDGSTKDFGISQDGIPRTWEKILAELAKCVMLCANCHREVHAGVRELPPRVSEDALPYAA